MCTVSRSVGAPGSVIVSLSVALRCPWAALSAAAPVASSGALRIFVTPEGTPTWPVAIVVPFTFTLALALQVPFGASQVTGSLSVEE